VCTILSVLDNFVLLLGQRGLLDVCRFEFAFIIAQLVQLIGIKEKQKAKSIA